MGEVGHYELKLYCDCDATGAAYGTQGHNNNVGQYTGTTQADARARARAAGWTTRGGKWLSPTCRAAGRTIKRDQ